VTATVMTALREVIERKGAFCALYSDRASHFFHTPKTGQAVDRTRPGNIAELLGRKRLAMSRRYARLSISDLHEGFLELRIAPQ